MAVSRGGEVATLTEHGGDNNDHTLTFGSQFIRTTVNDREGALSRARRLARSLR